MLLASGWVTVAPPAAAGANVQPHSAVYAMVLDRSKAHRGLADARGRIDFKWVEGCDGWTVEQRTLLVMTDTQGTDFSDSWALTAWESKDGLSYRFSVENRSGDGEPRVWRGKAQKTLVSKTLSQVRKKIDKIAKKMFSDYPPGS